MIDRVNFGNKVRTTRSGVKYIVDYPDCELPKRPSSKWRFWQENWDATLLLLAWLLISVIVIQYAMPPEQVIETEYIYVEVMNDEIVSQREHMLQNELYRLFERYTAQHEATEQYRRNFEGLHLEHAHLRELHDVLRDIISSSYIELERYREAERRLQPRYNYGRRHPHVSTERITELQWLLHDILHEHAPQIPEFVIASMIPLESGWREGISGGYSGRKRGLTQMSDWWRRAPLLAPYRIDGNGRNLLQADEHIKTLIEVMLYFERHIDSWETCYWKFWHFHSSGRYDWGTDGQRCCGWCYVRHYRQDKIRQEGGE